MAWYIRNTQELWTGPTHTLHGFTWTEATHMSYSVKLEEGPEPCLLYTSPSPRDATLSRMPSSA